MLGHGSIAVILDLLGIGIVIGWVVLGTKAKVSSIPMAVYLTASLCFVISGTLFLVGFLKRKATEMAVTNKRVIVKTGIAERRTVEILLSRIESVAVDEPALGRLLGYGTVIVRGTGGTPETFEKIYHPLEFREQVKRQIGGWARPASWNVSRSRAETLRGCATAVPEKRLAKLMTLTRSARFETWI